ncbi:type III secretion protein J [Mesorhizobium robiniae]|uniref:Lipoprotein n=1 Tax=Mesorhizobium robiniae TaxID=559315 RepID=A0ABV2GT65_9HYPH
MSHRSRRLAIVVGVLSTLLFLQACSVELYTGLSQQQANEIVATLVRNGISAERTPEKDGKMKVTVGEGNFAEAMALLNDHGLPKQEFATLGDVFKRDGLVSSPVEERAAMIFGLSQELSRTISDIDGVLTARVHLVLPENDPLRQKLVPSSASVFIRHQAATSMENLIPQVKMLVANGVAGLAYDNVSVVLIPVAAPPERPATAPPLASFFGLQVHPDSLTATMWIVYGLGAAVLVLSALLVNQLLNRGRRRVYALNQTTLPARHSEARYSEAKHSAAQRSAA